MSKAVMISIQPKWCELIASGKKTVEVRKSKPKIEIPFKCYIYCTEPKHLKDFGLCKDGKTVRLLYKWNYDYARAYRLPILSGKVIGEFICDEIFPIRVFENGGIQDYMWHSMERSCVPYDDISKYIGKDKTGYGWHISGLVIYDKPREINEFVSASTLNTNCFGQHLKRLDRPPQSWCYVETLLEKDGDNCD